MGSNSGSADERKGAPRGRSSRTNASAAHSSSDSSGQVCSKFSFSVREGAAPALDNVAYPVLVSCFFALLLLIM